MESSDESVPENPPEENPPTSSESEDDEAHDGNPTLTNAYSVTDLLGELDSDDEQARPAVDDLDVTVIVNEEGEGQPSADPVPADAGSAEPGCSDVVESSPTYATCKRTSVVGVPTADAGRSSVTSSPTKLEVLADTAGSGTETYSRVYDEVLSENIYQDPVDGPEGAANAGQPRLNSSGDDPRDVYENIDSHAPPALPPRYNNHSEDDGWGSSEFEEYDDDRISNGTQNSQDGGEAAAASTKDKVKVKPEKKVELRRSQKKQRSLDVQSVMSPTLVFDRITARLTKTKSVPEPGVENGDCELQMIDVLLDTIKHPPAELPPEPDGLTTVQLKRRRIISTIVSSENNYTSSLRRLVEEYERPLLDPKLRLISKQAVQTIFHKVSDILQCHNMFHIELGEVVKVWDQEEKIGSVFTASFSKSIVFEVYSSFINNFSVAVDTAKKQARTKPAFAEFLKQKLESSPDRMSLFGLLVKPVQRFPQFIMLLQDLLKLTPRDHHDRLRLQIALTELDTLTHRLNETKRESENRLEAKRLVSHINGLNSVKLNANDTYLVRKDDMLQIKHKNGETQTRPRRLFLLSDQLVCTSVVVRDLEVVTSERYNFHWCFPIRDIQVLDPTLPSSYRAPLVSTSKTSIKSDKPPTPGDNNPYKKELNDMLHDLSILDDIGEMAQKLKLRYEGFSLNSLSGVTKSLQLMIRQKCDIDRCIITLSLPTRSNTGRNNSRVQCSFQADTPGMKHDWLLELHNVKLALEPHNHPAWFVAESDPRAGKLPLFIEPLALEASKEPSKKLLSIKKKPKEVKTNRTVATRVFLTSTDLPNGIGIQHLWVCEGGRVSIISLHTNRPCIVESFCIPDAVITHVESVPGAATATDNKYAFEDETVWMASDDDRIIICHVIEEDRSAKRLSFKIDAKVSCMKYHNGHMYVGLKTGLLYIYSRDKDGTWKVKNREKLILGSSHVSCFLPINHEMWAACESRIHIISFTKTTSDKLSPSERSHDLAKDTGSSTDSTKKPSTHIECMVKAGVGLMVSMKDSAVVRLFHLETLESLQDISIGSAISMMLNGQEFDSEKAHITCLLSESGLLWIGTSGGFVLTMPLPRLEGVPQVKCRPMVSYHSQAGNVQFLLAVRCSTMPVGEDAKLLNSMADSSVITRISEASKSSATESSDIAKMVNGESAIVPKHISASSPDLFLRSELTDGENDDGSVTDLYASLLQCTDADMDSELTGNAVVLRHKGPRALQSAQIQRNINVMSHRVMNRLSHAITRNRRSGHHHFKNEVPSAPSAADAEEAGDAVAEDVDEGSDADILVDPDHSSSHESSTDAKSVSESPCSNLTEERPVFERQSTCMSSYRRITVPAHPSMVSSDLVFVQSSKALIVVSGGNGYFNRNIQEKLESSTSDQAHLLLWKC